MRLPLFPLHQVMFPNEVVALHIFEPRYRQMLKDVLAGDRTFGIVLIRSGWESGEPADPYEIGTTALIRDSEIFPDGRANISVVGSGDSRSAGCTPIFPTSAPSTSFSTKRSVNPLPMNGRLRVCARASGRISERSGEANRRR